eukprot:jgi/Botrbrau1/1818/Bobra.146_1s0016.1
MLTVLLAFTVGALALCNVCLSHEREIRREARLAAMTNDTMYKLRLQSYTYACRGKSVCWDYRNHGLRCPSIASLRHANSTLRMGQV